MARLGQYLAIRSNMLPCSNSTSSPPLRSCMQASILMPTPWAMPPLQATSSALRASTMQMAQLTVKLPAADFLSSSTRGGRRALAPSANTYDFQAID